MLLFEEFIELVIYYRVLDFFFVYKDVNDIFYGEIFFIIIENLELVFLCFVLYKWKNYIFFCVIMVGLFLCSDVKIWDI